MNFLKQSTEIKVRVGPFVDVGDGFTPETGVALSTADEAEVLKANGAATVDISGATWAAVTGADGWYDLTLTTSHTNTVGELVVVVHDDSVCLPVFARFQVVEETVYDALYGASAAGELAVKLSTQGKADVNAEADTAIGDASLATASALATVDSNVDAILMDTGTTLPATLATIAGYIDTEIQAILLDTGTTIPGILGTPAGASLAADVAAVKSDSAAILTDTGTTLDGKITAIDTVVDAVKAKTDSLSFTTAGQVDANVQYVNDVQVTGNGTAGNEWGP